MNHQIDPVIVQEIAKEFCTYFKKKNVTKVLTVEASGIAPAIMVAAELGVPMLFAKKAVPSTISPREKYVSLVHSYTKNVTNEILVSRKYLDKSDRVLIIDDFLANGEAALGLANLVEQAGAKAVGVGICIEKSFQPGRQKLEEHGLDVYSICRIASLENRTVTFLEDN